MSIVKETRMHGRRRGLSRGCHLPNMFILSNWHACSVGENENEKKISPQIKNRKGTSKIKRTRTKQTGAIYFKKVLNKG